jgi:hypothetical protein
LLEEKYLELQVMDHKKHIKEVKEALDQIKVMEIIVLDQALLKKDLHHQILKV